MPVTPTSRPPCVIRFQKLRSWRAIRLSAGHTWRADPVPHADPARAHLNEDWRSVNTPDSLADALAQRLECLTKPPAAGAVLCLEFLVTARRAAFVEHGGQTEPGAYFRDALVFLEARHGAENVLAVNIQRDEQTPHLVAYVAPLVERPARTVRRSVFAPGRDENGRQRREVRAFPRPAEVALSASHYYGSPAQTTALQTEFAAEVASRHGLVRGLEMSAATHTTNAAHHAAVARAAAGHIALSADDLVRHRVRLRRESPAELARRLSERIRQHYAPVVASAATAEHDRRRARAMVETARRHRERRRIEESAHRAARIELEKLTRGLMPDQRRELESRAFAMRLENRRAEAERKAREQVAIRRAQEAPTRAPEARSSKEDMKARKLAGIAPETLARLPEPERLRCWRVLRGWPGLELDFERAYGSGLFDEWGRLSRQGVALVRGESPRHEACRHGGPRPDPETSPGRPGGKTPGM